MNERLSRSVNKYIPVPLPYVFEWLTDFREDDPQLTGSDSTKTIHEKTPSRVIYTIEQVRGLEGPITTKYAVDIKPPDKWHYKSIGDDRDSVGDYSLYSDGDGTQIEMTFVTTYKNVPPPTVEEADHDSNEFWDKIISILVKDYREGKPSK